MLYLWLKALHVVAIVAWFAGLFYLPRLFAYHADATPGSEADSTFKVMEARLLRAIMNPALVATWVLGISLLVVEPGWLSQGWLHAKLLVVVLLTAFHMLLARWRRAFAEGTNTRPSRFFRMVNELPTLGLIVIVVMVVVKPF